MTTMNKNEQATIENCTSKYMVFLALLLLLYSNLVLADESALAQEVSELLAQQQYSAAGNLIDQNLDEYEGEPGFDYLAGLAYKSSGRLQEAVFAFERVLVAWPNSVEARYGLGACYYDMGNYDAAEVEFGLLLKSQLTSDLTEKVQRYVDAINSKKQDQKSHWANSFAINVGHDSNANGGPDTLFILLPQLGRIELDEANRELSSSFLNGNLQFDFFSPLTQQSAWFAGVQLYAKEFSDSKAWSRHHILVSGGYQKTYSDYQVTGTVFVQPYWLDGDKYLDFYGGLLTVNYKYKKGVTLGIDTLFSHQSYDDNDSLDRNQISMELWSRWAGKQSSQKISIKVADVHGLASVNDLASQFQYGLGYEYIRRISQSWIANLSLDYINSEFDDVNAIFGGTRDDDYIRASLSFDYKADDKWLISFGATTTNNQSNLSIYDYDKNELWLGSRYSF